MSIAPVRNSSPRRALIVIDVQNDYDGGELAIQSPPFRVSVENVTRAMDVATAAGVKVVVVKQLAPESSPIFANGSRGGEIHAEIARRPHDHYVEKLLPSAFTGTDLEQWLRANAIDTVTIVGYMTHNCILSTIVQALHLDFAVEFLSDAGGSVSYANSAGYASAEDIHRVICVVLQSRFAAVLRTAEWATCLETNSVPERDNIYTSYRQAVAQEAARR
ncbi:cysteine hydrolase family protein [Methylocystis sp. IM3]|uniref:cysteine hydrolase family protein n=1 Tax=unclassified Methylocystis TaxID=2625913 RepID=UPI0030FD17FB